MATVKHRDLGSGEGHIVHSFVFANAAARAGGPPLTINDIGRIAFQQDTQTFWILTNYSPRTWLELGSANLQTLLEALVKPPGYAPGATEWYLTVNETAGDLTPPTITAFTVPATANSLTVAVSSLVATDAGGVTGYLVNESAVTPAASDPGWLAEVPADVTCGGTGLRTLYAWAKDAAGNVSAAASAQVTITLADSTAPVITAFDVPATSNSTTVAINTLTATDAVGVTGYMVTESATPPGAGDAGWTGSAPASITVGGAGARTLYAWAKDAAGNVSTAATDTCTVTLADENAPFLDTFADASLDATHWTGSGTNPPVETTLLTLATTAVGQSSHLALKQAIEKATHTWSVDLDGASTFNQCTWWMVSQRATQPTPRSGGAADATYRIYLQCTNSGASRTFSAGWQNTSNAHQALLTNNGLGYTGSVRVVLESTATQWRLRILRVDTLAELYASAWVNWSSLRNDANPLWLEMGDLYTDVHYASINLTRFERT